MFRTLIISILCTTITLGAANNRFPLASLPFSKKKFGPTELISFHGPDCELCDEMEPYMQKTEKGLGKKILRFDTALERNYELLQRLDNENKCGGLPYFYNRASHSAICGATTYENLRKWAKGQQCELDCPPPLSREFVSTAARRTGFSARLTKKLSSLKDKGIARMTTEENDDYSDEE
mmetsp:Transcript_54462/g.108108  ORF Transcript_54462/g.108108 Transcript_54462/m.108108 type:complete len:179 (-) Transcript_54462:305-841(-)